MNKPSSVQSSSIDTLLQVSPEQIVPNPQQPRKHFDEKSLNELAQSISAQGVLQPLVVRNTQNSLISMNWLLEKEDGVP